MTDSTTLKIISQLDNDIINITEQSDHIHHTTDEMDAIVIQLDKDIQNVINNVKSTLSHNEGAPIKQDNQLSLNLKDAIAIKEKTIADYDFKLDELNYKLEKKTQDTFSKIKALQDILPREMLLTYQNRITFILYSLKDFKE